MNLHDIGKDFNEIVEVQQPMRKVLLGGGAKEVIDKVS